MCTYWKGAKQTLAVTNSDLKVPAAVVDKTGSRIIREDAPVEAAVIDLEPLDLVHAVFAIADWPRPARRR